MLTKRTKDATTATDLDPPYLLLRKSETVVNPSLFTCFKIGFNSVSESSRISTGPV